MEEDGKWSMEYTERWRIKEEREGKKGREEKGMEKGKGKGTVCNFHFPQHCLHPRSHRLRRAGAAALPAAGEEPGHS